jgi:acyl carrier protein
VTQDEIRRIALDILAGIAPEADLGSLSEDDEVREVRDLDSMDFLNFITALHKATGADIPEADYKRLSTLAGVGAYLGGIGKDP